jgi:HNH endonuclease
MSDGYPEAYDPFWGRVARMIQPEASPCWIWMGPVGPSGYGFFSVCVDDTPSGYSSVRAHRYAYALAHGEIPEGLHIDHLCRNRACVNPDHLEAVTPLENMRRSMPYRKPPTNKNRGASIQVRPRADGTEAYRVLYRLDGRQRGMTFSDRAEAEAFCERARNEGIEQALAQVAA